MMMPRSKSRVAAVFAIAGLIVGCNADSSVMPDPVMPDPVARIYGIIVGIGAPHPAYVYPGMALNMFAQANDSNHVVLPVASYAWSSSDTTVATVDQDGHVITKKRGSTSIVARAGARGGGFSLDVTLPELVYSLAPDTSVMLPSQTRTLLLYPLVSGSPTFSVVRGAWSSSDPSVARVDTSGLETAVGPGRARISVAMPVPGAPNFTLAAEVNVQPLAAPLRFVEVVRGEGITCGRTATESWCWGSEKLLGTTLRVDQCFSISSYVTRNGYVTSVSKGRCAMEPVRVQAPAPFSSLSVENGTVCGLVADGRAYCWGDVQLFTSAGTSSQVPVPVSATLRFASFSYPCGVTTTHEAWCWGNGALRGTSDTLTTPSQVAGGAIWQQVTGGNPSSNQLSDRHRCGIMTTGIVSCWGTNVLGQLGTGDSVSSQLPVPIRSASHFTKLAISWDHSCGLTDGGAILCWGAGHPTPFETNPGVRFTTLDGHGIFDLCVLRADGAPYCGRGSDAFSPLPVSTRFTSLYPAGGSYCGIGTDGITYCWGFVNSNGELGIGTQTMEFGSGQGTSSTPVRVVGQ